MNTLCNYTQELIHGNFYLKLKSRQLISDTIINDVNMFNLSSFLNIPNIFARIYRVTNETINISK